MDQILVIDDEKFIRDVLKELLEHYGYEVRVACNGREGLECLLNSNIVKLIITDIKMPVMDGIEFARNVRHSGSARIPIIAISAFPGANEIKKGLFNAILSKPFDLKSLVQIVDSYCA